MTTTDVGAAETTRVLAIYDLTPRARVEPGRSIADCFDYGRFLGHVQASARLLPSVVHAATIPAADFELAPGVPVPFPITDPDLFVLATPRGDLLLVLQLRFDGSPDATDVIKLLAPTCFERDAMTVAGQAITSWLTEQLAAPTAIRFGRNVHQCVFPGGPLREQMLTATADAVLPADARSIVYRGMAGAGASTQLGVRIPTAINNPGGTLVAHGRGVSLIAGWSEQVENALALTAMTNVAAIGVLHRARHLAFDALEANQAARLASTSDARELVSRLSTQLNDVQLDITFGVEAYADSVLIPELVVDNFQSSMWEAAGLDTGLANTSRMIERLGTVIGARAAVLDAATQEQAERRDRLFNGLLAAVSLLALPPGLLLAFFGVNGIDVDETRSILDISRYWAAYALAWLPFAGLLLIAYWLRRRIRVGTPNLSGFDYRGSHPQGTVSIPPQRAGSMASFISRVRSAQSPRSDTP